MPPGADAIVPVEDVEDRQDHIVVRRRVEAGRYIARRGSDCAAGTAVLAAGTRLGPAQMAVAASIGAAKVTVFAKPVVGLLTTGDEIVPIDAPPGPSQIRDSNNPMLAALLQRLGCTVYDFGHVGDDRDQIREKITKSSGCQALFITGGMSMGRYDHVPPILRELKFDLRVTKLRIKPGKPFIFAVGDDQSPFVFGLPGNPVSAFVCTLRLASRLLSRIAGEAVREGWLDAELESPLPANGPREFYLPAVLVRSADRTLARPLQWKGSGDVFTLARADALLVRPENDAPRPAGSRVQLLEVPR
jgi:molybdopterin molybdotransferase